MTFPTELWNLIRHYFNKSSVGRPPKYPLRLIFEACLYIDWSGIRWSDLPLKYPPPSTVYYWFKKWCQAGVFRKALRRIVRLAEKSNLISMSLWFIDGMFIRSKGSLKDVGNTKCGKGHKMMAITDQNGFPVSVLLTSASPHESKLVGLSIDRRLTHKVADRLMGDRAYDSDPLDQEMLKFGIRMLAPHKKIESI